MPWLLYVQVKSPQYAMNKGLSGPLSQSRHHGEENLLPFQGNMHKTFEMKGI
jgi:hypothetical protein